MVYSISLRMGIMIVQSTTLEPPECSYIVQPNIIEPITEEGTVSVIIKEVIINEKYMDHKVKLVLALPEVLRKELVILLQRYAYTFA